MTKFNIESGYCMLRKYQITLQSLKYESFILSF